MSLNDPRTLPYAFRVFERDGWVWLYDESSRTFPCSVTPHIWAEPLYPLEYDENGSAYDIMPDPGLFSVSRFTEGPAVKGSKPVLLNDEYIEASVEEKEAWDAAREEANANHII